MIRIVKHIVGLSAKCAAHIILAFTPKSTHKSRLADDAILEGYGYELKPLWVEKPKLSATTIDVSIIIPCYNAEKYIKRLLDTVLQQRTSCKYEIIAVDDGSTDGTLDVLKGYAARYANLVVFHQENSGISIARNKGIELAKGEYVGFADNDDFLSLNFIEILYSKAKQCDADMVQCNYSEVSPTGEQQASVTPNRVMDNDDVEGRGRYVSGFVWRSLYRKSCFENVRFPERFWYEDMVNRMVFMRILSKIVTISDVLYYKCCRGDSEAIHQAKGSADVRKIDQYWLAKSFVEFTTKKLGYPINDSQYRQLLHEWGCLLWNRTRSLDGKCQRDVFYLAASYFAGLCYHCSHLSDIEKTQEDALRKGNYRAWVLMSIASKLL